MLLVLGWLFASQGLAQHGNVWALGYKRGIDFNVNPPRLIRTGIMDDTTSWNEAVTSVSYSDCEGKLLVYGSSRQLWNKNHKTLKNGFFGLANKLTSCLLLPKPENPRFLYFLYHESGRNCREEELKFAIIDLNGDNGLGEVVVKDQFLDIGNGHLTYARHSNGRDIWIINGSTENSINCFLLSDTGISRTKVANSAFVNVSCPTVYQSNYNYAYTTLKVSSIRVTKDGRSLISTGIDSSTTKLGCSFIYDFDPSNGIISNQQVLLRFSDIPFKPMHNGSLFQGNYFYCEVSPNDSFIYFSEHTYNISNIKSTIVQINRFDKRKRTVFRNPTGACMQIGPDGKIYFIGSYDYSTGLCGLYAITKPNQPGIKCAVRKILSDSFIYFEQAPQTYEPYRQLTFNSNLNESSCRDSAEFIFQVDTNFLTIKVYFGDGDSLDFRHPSQSVIKLKHKYRKTGWYYVNLKAQNPGCSSFSYWGDSLYYALTPEKIKSSLKVLPACSGSTLQINDSFINTDRVVIAWQLPALQNDTLSPSGSFALSRWFDRDSGYTKLKWMAALSNADCPDYSTYPDSAELSYLKLPLPDYQLSGSTADTLTGCQPLNVTITNRSQNSVSYYADWGDGELLSRSVPYGSEPKIYQYSGNYLLTLTDTSADRCIARDTFLVRVNRKPLSILSSPSPVLCFADNKFMLRASSDMPCTYTWLLPQNTGFSKQNDSTINGMRLTNTGTSEVRLYSETADGCKDTSDITLQLMPELKAVFSGDSASRCLKDNRFTILHDKDKVYPGTTTGYRYDNISGSFNQGTGGISYNAPGTFMFRYILSGSNGCMDSLDIYHRVFKQPSLSLQVQDECYGTPVSLVFTGDVPLRKSTLYSGDGSVYPANTLHKYKSSGRYTVSVSATDFNGCTDSVSKTINIYSRAESGMLTDSVCQDEPLFIIPFCKNISWDSIAFMELKWDAGSKRIFSPSKVLLSSGIAGKINMMNIVTTNHLCSDTIYGAALVYSKPVADFTWTRTGSMPDGISMQFTDRSSSATGRLWDFGDGSALSTDQNPMHKFSDSGRYQCLLRVTSMQGCEDTVTKSVRVVPYLPVYIPDAFSPNDDGINDVFKPSGTELLESWQITIYDRWGGIIYDGLNGGWNGLDTKGIICPDGVYTYRIVIRGIDKKRSNFSGTILLVR